MNPVSPGVILFINDAYDEASQEVQNNTVAMLEIGTVPSPLVSDADKAALIADLSANGWTASTVLRFKRFIEDAKSDAGSSWTLDGNYNTALQEINAVGANDSEVAFAAGESTIPIIGAVQSAFHSAKKGASSAIDAIAAKLKELANFGDSTLSIIKYVLWGAVVLIGVILVVRVTSFIPRKRKDV